MYKEVSTEAGIHHHAYDPNLIAGGIAVFDYNNDGFDDIYFTGGRNADKLYENLGNGNFKDVTAETGVSQLSNVKTVGVVAGDVNNDGYSDLFVTTARGERCYLMMNEQGATFKDVSVAMGIVDDAWSSMASMADYDLDGDLDIYVGNYAQYDDEPYHLNVTGAEEDFFYENDGSGRFTKVNSPLDSDMAGCTLVSSFSDIDQDGDPDLLVLHDFGEFYSGNQLLLNDRLQGTFQNISEDAGMNVEINSMGIACGDFDEDGDFDYYVTNIGNNFLFERLEGIRYNNISRDKKVNDGTGFSWGTAFLDVDNDSYLDLFVSKGSIIPVNDPQTNKLFKLNPETSDFVDVSHEYGVADPNRARGMAYGDFNNDGRLDIVVANVRIEPENEGNALLYINNNESNNNWIEIFLEGTTANKSAYGSRISASSNQRTWNKELTGGSSFLSSHSNVVHFGLGNNTSVEELTINWPGGKQSTFTDLPANKIYKVVEDDNIYIYKARRIEICTGESIFLEGQDRTEAGIYVDTIYNNGSLSEIVLTKLAINEIESENCSAVITSLDRKNKNINIRIFPNPFDNDLTISLPENTNDFKLSVLDLSGRTKHKLSENIGPELKVHIPTNWQPGIYILKMQIGDKIYYQRIIKR